MNFDSQSTPKNGNGTHSRPRRLSGARRATGTGTDLPLGRAASQSTLDEFIASANSTMSDMDGWNISDVPTPAPEVDRREEEAREAQRAAAEATARVAAQAEAEAAKMLAEIRRQQAEQMKLIEAKLAEVQARAISPSQADIFTRTTTPMTAEQYPEAFGSQQPQPSFSSDLDEAVPPYGGDMFMSVGKASGMPGWVKGVLIAAGTAVVVGGIFVVGNGRLWNKPAKSDAVVTPVAAPAQLAAAQPAAPTPVAPTPVAAAPAPAAQPLPEAAAPSHIASPAIAATAQPEAAAPETAPEAAPAAAPAPAGVPMITSMAPTVEALPEADEPAPAPKAKKKAPAKKKAASAAPAKKPAKKSAPAKSGGIVDPFAS